MRLNSGRQNVHKTAGALDFQGLQRIFSPGVSFSFIDLRDRHEFERASSLQTTESGMLLYRHFFTGLRFPSLIIESCWVSNGFIPVKSWVSLNYQFILRTVGIFPRHRVFKWTKLNSVWIYVRWPGFKLIHFFILDITPIRTAWPQALNPIGQCEWLLYSPAMEDKSFIPTYPNCQVTQIPPRMKSVSTFSAVWSKPCQHGAVR